ncbi:hypothetical protein [Bacillus thuringiensis]|uniref:hypothetical protein n=1 Tax=Bacillus thuringiensis TaxID=1428 RepID=UPI000BF3811E|nr:hypothetical protein [Bacillus thuringiensis]PFJ58611.1 hypothetical protein COJ10_24470 [Bacillus thuringiensis]
MMNDKVIEKFFPALFDRMIDEQKGMGTGDVVERILTDRHNRLGRQSAFSKCMLEKWGGCNDIIDAHSIQNNGILSNLAENGRVLLLERDDFDSKKLDSNLIGKNEATIFRGFCKRHDEIFNPIEHNMYESGNLEQNYLFAYRAFSKSYIDSMTSHKYYIEYINKLVENEQLEQILEKHGNNIHSKEEREWRKKVVFKRQELRMKAITNHMQDLENLKIAMNTNLKKERFFKIETAVFEFPIENVIASSCLLYIYADLHGKVFNPKLKIPCFLTIIPQGKVTVVLLSYLKTHKWYFKDFINEIQELNILEQQVLFSNILLRYGDNIVFKPSHLKSYSPKSLEFIRIGLCARTQQPGEKLVKYPVNLFRL